MDELFKTILIAIVAFLYSAVGHGGATGYISTLSLFGLAHDQVAGTTLLLNTCVAGLSLFFFARAGQLNMRLAVPFLLLSVPMAFIGARLKIDQQTFHYILAGVLILSALRFICVDTSKVKEKTKKREKTNEKGQITEVGQTAELSQLDEAEFSAPPMPLALAVGGALGLMSGIVGIGGGVFLSPILIFCRFADIKQTSAASALFIVANSISGLLGRYLEQRLDFYQPGNYLPVAIIAALAGGYLGAGRFSSRALQIILGVVLLVASTRLLV